MCNCVSVFLCFHCFIDWSQFEMSVVVVPQTSALPSHMIFIYVFQLLQQCHNTTQLSCDKLGELEKMIKQSIDNLVEDFQNSTLQRLQENIEDLGKRENLRRSIREIRNEESQNTQAANPENIGKQIKSRRSQDIERLLSEERKKAAELKNIIEHQRHKMRDLNRNIDRHKREKLELEEKLEKEREYVSKTKNNLQSEDCNCSEMSKDLAHQKEYDLELLADIKKERERYSKLSNDLETEKQFNRELDLNCADTDGNTALHRAAKKGNLRAVQVLLRRGADFNLKEKQFGRTPLLEATLYGRMDVVRYLIDAGANINEMNNKNFTPLHYAVWYGLTDMCRFLLSRGATVDALGEEKQTPLHLAARAGHMGTIKLLVHKGARLNAKDNYGNTPADWARKNKYDEVLEYLAAANSSKIRKQHSSH